MDIGCGIDKGSIARKQKQYKALFSQTKAQRLNIERRSVKSQLSLRSNAESNYPRHRPTIQELYLK